ncbi:MAG: hypothetical protein WCF59_12220 [Desulfobaccales bacterium]
MAVVKSVIVEKNQIINTYAQLWNVASLFLEKAEEDQTGSTWASMASLVFTAFSLEAYFNHIGEKVFKSWNALENLPPLNKLDVICEKLEIKLDYSRRPYQTIKALFKFRNELAHGKTVRLSNKEILNLNVDIDKYLGEHLKAWWQKYCTQDSAVRAREDSEKIMRLVHESAKIKDDPLFFLGIGSHSAKVTA